MSSTNPVFVLPRALDERGAAIAKELFDSCAMGAGQFCTRPGLTIVPKGDKGAAFVAELTGHVQGGDAGDAARTVGRDGDRGGRRRS